MTSDVDRKAAAFWKRTLPKGQYNVLTKEVKGELRDFFFIIEQLPKVYDHVTGGVLSKHMYYAETVNSVADEYVDRQIEDCDYKQVYLKGIRDLVTAEGLSDTKKLAQIQDLVEEAFLA